MRPVYTFTLRKPIVTTKFRLKVPRRWDSRRVGGQKRSTRGETGAPSMQEYKKIQEIELYYALPTRSDGSRNSGIAPKPLSVIG